MSHPAATQSRTPAIAVVLFSALMWAFWWLPVNMLEAAGMTGAWVGMAMTAPALLLCALALPFAGGAISSRAVAGAVLIGVAVTLYTISVSYTLFMRAVLIFYIAPAWSTMIECAFFGRRWTARAGLAIGCSFIGLLLISRGEVSFEGVGAIGDWMALFAGMFWAVGAAMVFSAKASDSARSLVLCLIGSVVAAAVLIAVGGPAMGEAPGFLAALQDGWDGMALGGLYLATILGCTMWGAARLAPAVMTYLLSVEIVAGVLAAALLLGEPFGPFEVFGALFILGAVFTELTRAPDP